jgi:hypothetical protein
MEPRRSIRSVDLMPTLPSFFASLTCAQTTSQSCPRSLLSSCEGAEEGVALPSSLLRRIFATFALARSTDGHRTLAGRLIDRVSLIAGHALLVGVIGYSNA